MEPQGHENRQALQTISPPQDLRQWLAAAEALGELRTVEGADWDLELGGIAELNYRRPRAPALLFDRIKDYPAGHRVLVGANGTPARVALTFALGAVQTNAEIVAALRGKPLEWERRAREFDPAVVTDGAVFQHVQRGEDVDLLRFPTPRWHEHDGGRYIGTGCAVVTRDPDGGWVNLGAYRLMLVDARTVTLNIIPGKHGRMHLEKWFAREGRCPVAVSLGHDPIFSALSGIEVPTGVSEYNYAGAIRGRRVRVAEAPVTGLPVPADAEIVIEGWVPADRRASEGPFGEWTGYYAGGERHEPVIEVAGVYHRDAPILVGSPPSRPPHDYSYYRTVLKSAMIQDALVKAGVPEVHGVWAHEAGGGRQFVVVSIRQRYCGHARQAGFVASQVQAAAYMGKWVVVVEDDIDPSDLGEVVWAMCTRCSPAEDVDFIRRAWGSRADPLLPPGAAPYNSRAIIDACRPFERLADFPRTARISPELEARIRKDWSQLLEG